MTVLPIIRLPRWQAGDLEQAIVHELKKLNSPSQEVTDWFRTALRAALSDETEYNRQQTAVLRK